MGSHKKQPISDVVADSLLAFFGCVGFLVTQNKTLPQVWGRFRLPAWLLWKPSIQKLDEVCDDRDAHRSNKLDCLVESFFRISVRARDRLCRA